MYYVFPPALRWCKQDKHGNTPLHCASYRGHEDVAVRLLQHGADVSLTNTAGKSPMDVAKTDAMKALLELSLIHI